MIKKRLVILGGSGIGMIAASIAELTDDYVVEGFLNDSIEKGNYIGRFKKKYPVLGATHEIEKYLGVEGYEIFVAYVGMTREEETFEKVNSLNIPTWQRPQLIHPTSIIPHDMCQLGRGILMGPHAQVSPDAEIEDMCIMLGGSFLGHDSKLRKFSHLATNAVVGANVVVGTASHIGSNSTLRERITVGEFSLVGAGSVVLSDVPEKTVVVGVPARPIRQKPRDGRVV